MRASAQVLSAGQGSVARLTFNLTEAGGTNAALSPTSTILSDPNARPLTVTGVSGSLTVTGGGGPTTVPEFTDRGWQSFEGGNLTAALSDFGEAINLDASYGPAHVGQGWARLGLATTGAAMTDAVSSFDGAVLAYLKKLSDERSG
jgi:hypothetical protein